ncbi:MAG TPA: glycosyltransferase family 39 protein [Ardenticatenaceae bacterium]|nr:glycosyltransferase family 39 protein [Ardenticatenaceae bacterium]
MNGRRRLVLLLLVLALAGAFWLRLAGADERAIWQDEGLTLYQIQQSIPFVLSNVIEVQGVPTRNTHPPLYFLLLALFSRATGISLFATRWFSVAWSLVAVAAFYVLGVRLVGRRVGLVAALMAALSPLYLWYAQEVRMYTMLVALSALSLYTLWRLMESVGRRRGVQLLWLGAYVLVTAAMLWTHYTAFFVLAVQGLAWLVLLGRRRLRAVLLAGAGLLLAAAPLLPFAWRRLLTGVERQFRFVPLDSILRDLLNGFTVGLSIPLTAIWWLDLLMLALLLVGLVGLWRQRRLGAGLLLWAVLLLPPVLLFAASYIKPLYQGVRHLIVISPAFYVLAAAGFAALAGDGLPGAPQPVGLRAQPLVRMPSWEQARAAGALVAGLLWAMVAVQSTSNYFTDSRYFKEDFPGLFTYIQEHFRPGDIVVLNDPVLSHVLTYYAPELPWTGLPPYGTTARTPGWRTAIQTVMDAHPRVWLVYQPFDTLADPSRRVRKWFDKYAYLLDDRSFRGMSTAVAVAYYSIGPIHDTAPLASNEPLAAGFEDGLDLVGVTVPERVVTAGRPLFYDLVWYAREQPARDYGISGRLIDASGEVWTLDDRRPFQGVSLPTSHWLGGYWVRVPLELRVPVGTPPGQYTLLVQPYDLESGRPLARLDGADPAVPLGAITVQAGPRPSGWQAPLPLEVRIGETLRLVGADVSPTVRVGTTPRVRLYFDVLAPVAPGVTARLDLVSAQGEAAWSWTGALLGEGQAGPDGLPPATTVAGQYQIALPATAAPGLYDLRLAVLDETKAPFPARSGWWPRAGESVRVEQLTVEDRPRSFELPALATPLAVKWAQAVTLRGAEWAPAAPGTSVPVTLLWQAGGPTERSYKVFVHLRDQSNQVVAQHDGYPAGGDAPTDTWAAGEVVRDEHALELRGELAPGRYTLVVGFYHEASGERLPLAGGAGDEWVVGQLEVRMSE